MTHCKRRTYNCVYINFADNYKRAVLERFIVEITKKILYYPGQRQCSTWQHALI